MKLKDGHICVAKVQLPGNWPLWYFAKIINHDEDDDGNWEVIRFQVTGENFIRDEHLGLYVIRQDDKQAAALKLSNDQWGKQKGYNDLDAVRAAILEIAP